MLTEENMEDGKKQVAEKDQLLSYCSTMIIVYVFFHVSTYVKKGDIKILFYKLKTYMDISLSCWLI